MAATELGQASLAGDTTLFVPSADAVPPAQLDPMAAELPSTIELLRIISSFNVPKLSPSPPL